MITAQREIISYAPLNTICLLKHLLWLTKYAGSVWVWQVVLGFFLALIVVSQSTRWAARGLTGSEERHHERLFRTRSASAHQTHPCGWQRPVWENKISAFYHLTWTWFTSIGQSFAKIHGFHKLKPNVCCWLSRIQYQLVAKIKCSFSHFCKTWSKDKSDKICSRFAFLFVITSNDVRLLSE